MRILVSGSSGLIGRRLIADLEKDGIAAVRLVRRAAGGNEIAWDPVQAQDPAIFEGVDAVVHLAGENIAGRWTAEKKKRMYESRVLGTGHLAEAMARAATPPRVLISASAVGIYGSRGEETLSEESSPGNDFLARLARDWEAATEAAEHAGVRTVVLRTGVVLAAEGGALPRMLTPFRLGLGGRIGSGRQWMSWVAIEDVIAIIRFALATDELHGPLNVVAPNAATNAEFTRTLARVLHRPALLPVPGFVVRALLGEMGEALLLGSARVRPRRLEKRGFTFRYPELEDALRAALA